MRIAFPVAFPGRRSATLVVIGGVQPFPGWERVPLEGLLGRANMRNAAELVKDLLSRWAPDVGLDTASLQAWYSPELLDVEAIDGDSFGLALCLALLNRSRVPRVESFDDERGLIVATGRISPFNCVDDVDEINLKVGTFDAARHLYFVAPLRAARAQLPLERRGVQTGPALPPFEALHVSLGSIRSTLDDEIAPPPRGSTVLVDSSPNGLQRLIELLFLPSAGSGLATSLQEVCAVAATVGMALLVGLTVWFMIVSTLLASLSGGSLALPWGIASVLVGLGLLCLARIRRIVRRLRERTRGAPALAIATVLGVLLGLSDRTISILDEGALLVATIPMGAALLFLRIHRGGSWSFVDNWGLFGFALALPVAVHALAFEPKQVASIVNAPVRALAASFLQRRTFLLFSAILARAALLASGAYVPCLDALFLVAILSPIAAHPMSPASRWIRRAMQLILTVGLLGLMPLVRSAGGAETRQLLRGVFDNWPRLSTLVVFTVATAGTILSARSLAEALRCIAELRLRLYGSKSKR